MVTAIGTAESVKEAIKLGAKGYIVKPWTGKRSLNVSVRY